MATWSEWCEPMSCSTGRGGKSRVSGGDDALISWFRTRALRPHRLSSASFYPQRIQRRWNSSKRAHRHWRRSKWNAQSGESTHSLRLPSRGRTGTNQMKSWTFAFYVPSVQILFLRHEVYFLSRAPRFSQGYPSGVIFMLVVWSHWQKKNSPDFVVKKKNSPEQVPTHGTWRAVLQWGIWCWGLCLPLNLIFDGRLFFLPKCHE